MHYETSVDIEAPAGRVWEVLTDLERWPEWTASMTRLEIMDGKELTDGSEVRVKQPRMRALVWRVIEFEPERSFSWTSRIGGVTTVGDHRLASRLASGPDGVVTVTLAIRQTGLLTPVVGLLVGAQTRRYLQLEAQGLKRRSEAAQE
jgi:uncharacterized membrane protein